MCCSHPNRNAIHTRRTCRSFQSAPIINNLQICRVGINAPRREEGRLVQLIEKQPKRNRAGAAPMAWRRRYCFEGRRVEQQVSGVSLPVNHRHQPADQREETASAGAAEATRVAVLEREVAALSAAVGHDLAAPLRIASGYLRLLREQHGQEFDPDAQHLLDVVEKQVADMERMLDDLLALSEARSGALHHEPLDMRRMAAEIAATIADDGTTTMEIAALHGASCDRVMLSCVWRHLFTHAFLRARSASEPRIGVTSHAVDGMICYRLRDNGPGLTADAAAALFDAPLRLSGVVPGAGMGLAIAREIIHRHGGRIWAEPGAGDLPETASAVCFTLPGAPAQFA
jgi:signal transduction histidine kinase